MSREAKIGMLTGMFVIVLIGVLLSEYLGNAGAPAQNTRSQVMPQLGEQYRRSTLQPVTVPGVARTSEPTLADLSVPPAYATDRGPSLGGSTPAAPVAAQPGSPSIPPLTPEATVPVTQPPVTPIPAGPIVDASKPVIPTIDTIDVKATQPVTTPTIDILPVAKPKGEEYTVAKGDTLDKISKKFFGAATKQNKSLIIAANPKSLHDETSVLVVGKKLTIPVPAKTETAKSDTLKTTTNDFPVAGPLTKKDTVIAPPGHSLAKTTDKPADTTAKVDTAKKTATKKEVSASLYVVKKGDTLEKIAKTVSASNYREVIKNIISANKLKDPDALKEGMKLSIPALKA